jgi:hypothetical protein
MDPVRTALISLWLAIDERRRQAGTDDRGMTTEMAIVTGLLAAAALVITGIVVARATGWAESIPQPGGG